jgi:hypothetical protein
MDKKIVGLVGALSVLPPVEAVQAMPAPAPSVNDILRVQSYVELLDPIPNAAALLRVVDAAPEPDSVQQVQYYEHHHHHHHHDHHHHGYYYYPYGYSPYGYYPY